MNNFDQPFLNPIGSPDSIIVCGGRDFGNGFRLTQVLDAMWNRWHFGTLIHGAAKGADSMAEIWASAEHYRYHIEIDSHPADWDAFGKNAGYVRNLQMANCDPDVVVAFPGGRGTEMMIEIARDKNIPAIRVSDNTMSRCH